MAAKVGPMFELSALSLACGLALRTVFSSLRALMMGDEAFREGGGDMSLDSVDGFAMAFRWIPH